jgi:hypothetical protein
MRDPAFEPILPAKVAKHISKNVQNLARMFRKGPGIRSWDSDVEESRFTRTHPKLKKWI